MDRSTFCVVLTFICLFCWQKPVNATPVTLQISGVVEQVSDPAGLLNPPLIAGSPFTATLIYDPGAVDLLPGDIGNGNYHQLPPIASLTIDVGGHHFEKNPAAMIGMFIGDGIAIGIDESGQPTSIGDIINVSSGEMSGDIAFDNLTSSLYLTDSTGTALDSDALPLTIDPGPFDIRRLSLSGFRAGTSSGPVVLSLILRPDVFTAIPEPSSFYLMGVGLLLLVGGRSRYKRDTFAS